MYVYSDTKMSGRKRSWVWDFFEKSEDEKEVTCSICGAVLCYNSSTSSLSNHLTKIHNKNRENESAHSAEAFHSEISSDRPNKSKKKRLEGDTAVVTHERQEEISRAVARLISTNMLPLSIVSSDGFRDFMKVIEPGYKVPCVRSIHSRLKLLYKSVKDNICNELAEASSVSISVDEWSSRTLDSYISVEAQYFNSKYDLCTATLCNKQLEGINVNP
ncbi:zinc finger BED domain-containing protein 1-like [Rhagoletis pomonella]|uniref:zinc finger BED domain-containing protein 1-like n=1 Tax=Rhagoletis pomonella TaxID=28610 RepID=UPI00177B6482|nr:zinc finger BED domain-containing protein 1-like [Rhagoletis pomonella]